MQVQKFPSSAYDPENSATVEPFEYFIVNTTASSKEMLSGDWEVSPADILSPVFLVFICDSVNLALWVESTNLTQAIGKMQDDGLLYVYQPYLIPDDIPLDNRRSDSFNVRVPKNDTWHLVFYAGASIMSLTFSWHIDVFPVNILNIILYSAIGLVVGLFGIILLITLIKQNRSKKDDKDEIAELNDIRRELREEDKKRPKKLGSLEDISEENEEL
ncbi:MAG: hypothetical protein U9O98_07755 [Asgard group archaeon]|nr:hypothetical protein [Asgard group archaeon]